MSQYEMSAITAVTLVIYGLVMHHERMKRVLAKQKPTSPELSATQSRSVAQAPRIDSFLLLKLALASLQLPRRKLR